MRTHINELENVFIVKQTPVIIKQFSNARMIHANVFK